MRFANPAGRDWSSVVNWDGLGKLYASIIIVWTTFLLAGVAWLTLHRNLYFLRIRNVTLGIASTLTLHVYLVKIFLAYTTNGHFPCGLEYWIMGIYLPFGIALFQLNLVQIYNVSTEQHKLLSSWSSSPFSSSGNATPCSSSMTFASHPAVRPLDQRLRKERGLSGLWKRWCRLTPARHAEVFVGIGLVVQLIMTLSLFLGSRRFHMSWGSFGVGDLSPAQCRRGGEWVPTAIWQLGFAWIGGPYILYKIRHVRDIHSWRIQIILCVVSGLPGTPLWIAALYGYKAFKHVNKFWVPPMWLAPGIMVMQFCTIFFPIYEAYTSRGQIQDAFDAVKASRAHWSSGGESKASFIRGSSRSTYPNSGLYTDSSESTQDEKQTSIEAPLPRAASTNTRTRKREMYSRAALEKALAINSEPLLQFATRKDFTGENIIFLLLLRQWRAWWEQAQVGSGGLVSPCAQRLLFRSALDIYLTSVCENTAAFPINIESKVRSTLAALFRGALWTLEQNSISGAEAVPSGSHATVSDEHFNEPNPSFPFPTKHLGELGHLPRFANSSETSHSSDMLMKGAPESQKIAQDILERGPSGLEAVPIPVGFDAHIFDDAEKEVKYMVVTNTWPRFVDSVQMHEDMKTTHSNVV